MEFSELIRLEQQAWTSYLRLAMFEHWLTREAKQSGLIPVETVLAAFRRRLAVASATYLGRCVGRFYRAQGQLLYIAGHAISYRHRDCLIAETLQGGFMPLRAANVEADDKTWQEVDVATWSKCIRRLK